MCESEALNNENRQKSSSCSVFLLHFESPSRRLGDCIFFDTSHIYHYVVVTTLAKLATPGGDGVESSSSHTHGVTHRERARTSLPHTVVAPVAHRRDEELCARSTQCLGSAAHMCQCLLIK
jgi:hypothetical protein